MNNFVDYLVSPDASLREVIEVIDKGAAQIALVVNSSNALLGVITDGDVRRAMLRNVSLTASAQEVMSRNFRSLPSSATKEEALGLMRHETLHQIPALDEDGRVVDLFLLEKLIEPVKQCNPVVIMAGGEGKRLYPLTQNCPKPMLPIQGKPALEIILEQCIEAGFYQFYFSVNYLKNQIKDHFGDGSRWGISIEYLEENQPLGTAGALSLFSQKPSEPLLVLNGDVLSRIDYARLMQYHSQNQCSATVCVREHVIEIPYGVVRVDNSQILEFEEKPVIKEYVNAGIYVIDPVLLDLVPNNTFFDMPQLFEKAIQSHYFLSAFPIHEYWIDVGHRETFNRAGLEWT